MPGLSLNLPLRPVVVESRCSIYSLLLYALLHRNDFVTLLLYYSGSIDTMIPSFHSFVAESEISWQECQLDTEHKSITGAIDSNGSNTRLTGSWLIIARVVWLVLVIPSLGLFLVSLPVYYQQLQRACIDSVTCNLNGALTAQGLKALETTSLSISGYAAINTIFFTIIAAIWCGVGFIIFWRRSDDWLALLAAFFLVMFSITSSSNNLTYVLALVYPVSSLPLSIANFFLEISLSLFFLLFPNGRFEPPWMGLILPVIIIKAFLNNFPSSTLPYDHIWPDWLYLLVTGVIYISLIYSQIYRYRRVSTPLQRQQTKWIILGVTAVVAFYITEFLVIITFNQFFSSIGNQNYFAQITVNFVYEVVLLLIPLSFAFSILRYRLYDIDLLINRTLVYGTLSVLLALVYFGLIFGLQYLFRGIISQNNDIAIVVSTLVIAALFQPLRQRIQAIIDRRFYRRKYDAAKVVEAFSATLRNEVDLDQLRQHLITVVQDTMQPAHVSLWLRKSGPERKLDTRE